MLTFYVIVVTIITMSKVIETKVSKIALRKNQPGGGRKAGSGKFREPTSVVRIPASQAPVIQDFLVAYQRKKLTVDLDAITEFEQPTLNAPSIKLPLHQKFQQAYPVRQKSI